MSGLIDKELVALTILHLKGCGWPECAEQVEGLAAKLRAVVDKLQAQAAACRPCDRRGWRLGVFGPGSSHPCGECAWLRALIESAR